MDQKLKETILNKNPPFPGKPLTFPEKPAVKTSKSKEDKFKIHPDDNVSICIWKVMQDGQWRTGTQVVELLKDCRYNELTIRQGLSNMIDEYFDVQWLIVRTKGRGASQRQYRLKPETKVPNNTRRMRTFKELGTKRGPRKPRY